MTTVDEFVRDKIARAIYVRLTGDSKWSSVGKRTKAEYLDAAQDAMDAMPETTFKEAARIMRKNNYEIREYGGYGTPGGRDPMG